MSCCTPNNELGMINDLQGQLETLEAVTEALTQDTEALAVAVNTLFGITTTQGERIDTLHLGGEWTPITAFTNGYSEYDGATWPIGYRADARSYDDLVMNPYTYRLVKVRGFLAPGTNHTVAFTLPPDFRPLTQQQFATISQNLVVARITVGTDGKIRVSFSGTPAWISLDGVSFTAREPSPL
jgi:hypothetical protein